MFDSPALYDALDDCRKARDLTWAQVAAELSHLAVEPAKRRNHRPPISAVILESLALRGDTSCQHALSMVRWLGRIPEDFVFGAPERTRALLPPVRPGQQLRWHIHRSPDRNISGLYEALDDRRQAQRLSWPALAPQLRCGTRELTQLQITRFAIRMTLVMEITQWLQRPSADFIYAADWYPVKRPRNL